MKNLFKSGLVALGLIAFASCDSNDDNNQASGDETARVAVRLTDAPGDYDAVFVDVESLSVRYSDTSIDDDFENDDDDLEDGEIILVNINAGVYDLLELTAGVNVLLVDNNIPAGNITQMRLILGDDNRVVVDGESFDLDTPSAQQSGLKINLNETLEEGLFYEFLLDFDVDKSIVQRGNGTYGLKPVIRASIAAESGAITGNVLPLDVQVLVTATDGVQEISAFTNDGGRFLLAGVPDGTYTLTFEADVAAGLAISTVEDVVVVNGEVNDIGTIFLVE